MIAEHWVFSYSFFLRLKQFLGKKMGKGRLVQESKTRVLCDLCGSGSGEWKSGTHFQVASTARADFLTISFRVQRTHGYHQKNKEFKSVWRPEALCNRCKSEKKLGNWRQNGVSMACWELSRQETDANLLGRGGAGARDIGPRVHRIWSS